MEREDIKFITGEIHFLELVEKKSSSLVFKGPSEEEISCTLHVVGNYSQHLIFQKLRLEIIRLVK